MSKSRVPSYRHHRPSGQAVVTLDGRDFYLGKWNTKPSLSEYERLTGQWLANGRRLPDDGDKADLRICELLRDYLAYAAGYYVEDGRPGKEYVCMKAAAQPLVKLYSRTRVVDFGPLALKTVRQQWVDKGLSRTHINMRVNRIRRIFKWGVENELVPSSVLHALQAVTPLKRGRTEAREPEPIRPVPDQHVDAVLSRVSRQVAAMIELQRLSGMRPGEVVIMRPKDVDRTGDVWVYTPSKHKTAYRGHERHVYLGPKAQAVLAPWLLRDAEAFCFSPREAEADRNAERRANRKTPMTPSQAKRRPRAKPRRAKRDRYDVASYRRAIKYGIKLAEVPPWHPHQLRHNYATRMRRDHGLDIAQVLLGHKTASVTEIYAEVDRAKAIEIVSIAG
jgi:integrase